ncbi:homeobox protein MSH-D-like protein [Lates japonicus]|uniref:Homeobox protein MSH-D-like protein n=1 Tax=Lates japonicus TaxID=270547 RepID=A0AAD3M3E4_LATJO|nr:homeobox protein MSH-D-like protein [Lates japonicus]
MASPGTTWVAAIRPREDSNPRGLGRGNSGEEDDISGGGVQPSREPKELDDCAFVGKIEASESEDCAPWVTNSSFPHSLLRKHKTNESPCTPFTVPAPGPGEVQASNTCPYIEMGQVLLLPKPSGDPGEDLVPNSKRLKEAELEKLKMAAGAKARRRWRPPLLGTPWLRYALSLGPCGCMDDRALPT